eukprot:TRINITY_DN65249_c0_g1_i1.p1 TRINITY_DN65249_c0_g1~~TRINITY_DN65249_c0_g1_i1.p1  ORF type:complete len:391 (+),score=113.93 TRINITY_DN65249_c0_g1_i1:63-1175(+)
MAALPDQRRVREVYAQHRGLYLDKSRGPEVARDAILLTATNWAFRLFYFNWQCFAAQHGLDYATLALDADIHRHISSGAAPALGPRGSVLTAEAPPGSAQGELRFGTAAYNVVTCAKLRGVLAFLNAGAAVFFSDPDNVFMRDPAPGLAAAARGFDLVFQPNDPACSGPAAPLDCSHRGEVLDFVYHLATRCRCQIANTGLYYASGSGKHGDSVRHLLSYAARHCYNITRNPRYAERRNVNDQVSFNVALHHACTGGNRSRRSPLPSRAWWSGKQFRGAQWCARGRAPAGAAPVLRYCAFAPAEHPAGVHAVDPARAVSLHANYVSGGAAKRHVLQRHGAWRWRRDPQQPGAGSCGGPGPAALALGLPPA